jgi:hypothetical protein
LVEQAVQMRAAGVAASRALNALEAAIPGVRNVECAAAAWNGTSAKKSLTKRVVKAVWEGVVTGTLEWAHAARRAPMIAIEAGREAAHDLEAARRGAMGAPLRAKGIEQAEGPLDAPMQWQAKKPTFHVGPWLLSEKILDAKTENLYANGGPCAKYDQAFGTKSQAYQREHYHRDFLAVGGDALWAGFCPDAAAVSSLLEEPKHAVVKNGVTFTPEDIKGLLVLAARDLQVGTSDNDEAFNVGLRFGDESKDPNEPYPHTLHEKVFRRWGAEKQQPFVMDIDPGRAVWNYAYDGGHVQQLERPPAGFDPKLVPLGGAVKYYQADVTSSGYPEKDRHLAYWIHTDANGKQTSGWIKNTAPGRPEGWTDNPDFAWRPIGGWSTALDLPAALARLDAKRDRARQVLAETKADASPAAQAKATQIEDYLKKLKAHRDSMAKTGAIPASTNPKLNLLQIKEIYDASLR